MSDNVDNVTHEILKRIQAEMAEGRRETNARLDRIEDQLRRHRRDISGMLVLMKSAAGDFDARVTAVEERLDAIDGGRAPI